MSHSSLNGSNTTELICGSSTSHVLYMPPDSCNDEKTCERVYHVYIPSRVCSSMSDNINASIGSGSSVIAAEDMGTLPLVFAVHCLGCTADVMDRFEEVAESFQFILVRPVGISRSWNAKYCCGPALKKNVDDFGFFNLIMEELDASYDFIDRELAYGVGWSNGGYMVSYAARLFRAIAPIAGYQYGDDLPFLSGHTPKGIFQHHSINDQFVRFNGCCMAEGMEQCCCGISQVGAEQCTSVTEGWDNWAAKVNNCNGPTTTTQLKLGSSDNSKDGDDEGTITCYYGGSCQANTTLCVYDDRGHFNRPSFSIAFPMFDEIGHFFARDACSLSGGRWDIAERKCICGEEINMSSRAYCLASGNLEGILSQDATTNSSDFSLSTNLNESGNRAVHVSNIGAFIVVTFAIFFGIFRHAISKDKANEKKKNDEWDRLTNDSNEVELSSLRIETL